MSPEQRENYARVSRERAAEKRDYLNTIKTLCGCAKCGYDAHAQALDFNHLDPTQKRGNIAERVSSWGWNTLMEEVLKCEVLCANCHRLETHVSSAA